jgi:hypothetical protein
MTDSERSFFSSSFTDLNDRFFMIHKFKKKDKNGLVHCADRHDNDGAHDTCISRKIQESTLQMFRQYVNLKN